MSSAAVSPDASTVLPVITPEAFTVVVVRVVIVVEVCVPPTTPLIVGAVRVLFVRVSVAVINEVKKRHGNFTDFMKKYPQQFVFPDTMLENGGEHFFWGNLPVGLEKSKMQNAFYLIEA